MEIQSDNLFVMPGKECEEMTHTIIPRTERPSDHNGQLRYSRTRDGAHHLRSVLSYPTLLRFTANL